SMIRLRAVTGSRVLGFALRGGEQGEATRLATGEYASGRQLLAELCGQDEATLVVELLHMSAQHHVVSPLSKPIGSDSNHSTPLPSTYSSVLPHRCSNSHVFPGQIGGGEWGLLRAGATQRGSGG